jgi:hypothetical protein
LNSSISCIAAALIFCLLTASVHAQSERKSLLDALHFHANFDGSADAKVAVGDGRVFTAESLDRKQMEPGIKRADVTIAKGAGKYGDCLRFADKAKPVICYAGDVMHYQPKDWSGTVSMWMRLNPDADLKPGYCDPLQITQFAWNNGAFFVDFDKDLPRDFRLGVFSDLKIWNPQNITWEAWPVDKRPMVTVKKPPFSRDAWTHVLFTFSGVNDSKNRLGKADLYINGQLQGRFERPLQFTWDVKKAAIMLGIEYIGDIDELMIFRRELNEGEVKYLYNLPESL